MRIDDLQPLGTHTIAKGKATPTTSSAKADATRTVQARGTSTQLICRGAPHGYPKISAFASTYVLVKDVSKLVFGEIWF
jgi:hypothetical protein